MNKMLQKIKNHLALIVTVIMTAVPIAAPVAVGYAADSVCSGIGGQVSIGANQAAGSGANDNDCSTNSGVDNNSIGEIGHKIVNIFSLLIGVVAVIMIIVGGFRYITSGGDSNRVGGAKNTLIYAIIGLVIVALAQIIVHFVLNQTNGAVSGS